MEPTYVAPSTAALLDNASWVQRLARHLIADEHLAQDVAQEAMTTAIERPPAFAADTGRLRRWLTGLTRRLAVNAVTRGRGRIVAEERASRPEADTSDAAATERLRLHRRLAEGVLELEPIYRSALVMRYFDGLAPREIAERLELPPSTIHKRLSRGLEQLRGQLDREYGGDRRAWCLALGELVRAPSSPPPSPVPWGLGSKKVLLLAGAGLLGLLSVAVFLSPSPAPAPTLSSETTARAEEGEDSLVPFRTPPVGGGEQVEELARDPQ